MRYLLITNRTFGKRHDKLRRCQLGRVFIFGDIGRSRPDCCDLWTGTADDQYLNWKGIEREGYLLCEGDCLIVVYQRLEESMSDVVYPSGVH